MHNSKRCEVSDCSRDVFWWRKLNFAKKFENKYNVQSKSRVVIFCFLYCKTFYFWFLSNSCVVYLQTQ